MKSVWDLQFQNVEPKALILEGIMSTVNETGSANISPMGPIVDARMQTLTLRPYQTSKTYRNLKRTGEGVFHVTDDVLLLARAAVNLLDAAPPMLPAEYVRGFVIQDACRWYEIRVRDLDDRDERTTIIAEVVGSGRQRDFFGFNRAKHAVVEAAILATRIKFLPPQQILDDFDRLRVLVEKTGGPREHEAFAFLDNFLNQSEASRGLKRGGTESTEQADTAKLQTRIEN